MKTIDIGDTRLPVLEQLKRLIARLKPGQCVLALDFAKEVGVSASVVSRMVPEENRLIRRVPGNPRPVLLICPKSDPSRRPRKKK